jgi:hypothetical protein
MPQPQPENLIPFGADREARRPIVGPGGATEAVDAQDEEAARRREEEARQRRRRDAVAWEAREALARDQDCDRLAYAINVVSATEFQHGRAVTSRKGAWTILRIKDLLDELHADDAPVVYPQFAEGALGGRSALPMAAIEKALGVPSPLKRDKPETDEAQEAQTTGEPT